MIQLAIIADDLTGALDTGIKFAEKGIVTQLIFEEDFEEEQINTETELLIFDTETRHVSADKAYEKVFRIVRKCMLIGVRKFYKKTDSGMRGHIGSELKALYDATGVEIVFAPALPGEHRYTKKGIQYIGNSPVAESIFGKDPMNPVKHSRVIDIIQEEVSSHSLFPVIIYDSVSEEDLENIAGRINMDSMMCNMAGCSGFASHLVDKIIFQYKPVPVFSGKSKLFVITGSLNEVTKEQIIYAQKHGSSRFSLNEKEKFEPEFLSSERGRIFIKQIKQEFDVHDIVMVDVCSKEDTNEKKKYINILSKKEIADRITYRLSEIFNRIRREMENITFFVIGGDTLYTIIQKLGYPVIQPICEIMNGTIALKVKVDNCDLFLISKSGGFGEKDLIIKLKDTLSKDY